MKLRAVLFDAYGTLFDVYSVAVLAERLFPGQGNALSVLWRDKQIDYTRLVTMSSSAPSQPAPLRSAPSNTLPPEPSQSNPQQSNPPQSDPSQSDRYQPFSDLTLASLRHAAARLQLPLSADAEAALMDAYLHLAPFPENQAVLAALQARGVPAGILSNGNPEMLQPLVQNAGFAPLLQHVLSVHGTRRYKTDPAVYALGPQAFGVQAGDILFVSSNAWDALGATWFGYTTLWINRGGAPREQIGPPPTHTGSSLRDVQAVLDAAS